MPRPSIEVNARNSLREYLALAERLSPTEAPLNTSAVAKQLNFDRKTLKKYRLDEEITAAAERQARSGGFSQVDIDRRSVNEMLRVRDQELEAMRRRCEALVEQVCLAEGNAQRLGIDPVELWKPLPLPDRTLPHGGYRRRPHPSC